MAAYGRKRPPQDTGTPLAGVATWRLGAAAAVLVLWALTAGPAVAGTEALQRLHAECAALAANSLADTLGPALARQAPQAIQLELESRVAFGLLRERRAPGRGSVANPVGTFLSLYRLDEDPAEQARLDAAGAAADTARARYLALGTALELLRGWSFAAGVEADPALLAALDVLLPQALADGARVRAAGRHAGPVQGHDTLEASALQAMLGLARSRYQACALAGTAGLGGGAGLPQAPEIPSCVVFVEVPATVAEVFTAPALLGPRCLAELAPGPLRAQVAQTVAIRAQGFEARLLRPPPTQPALPNGGPLRDQVLTPDEIRLLFGRGYAIDTHCHARAASFYRQAMEPFLDAARQHAADALERQHVAQAQRSAAEISRLLRTLERNLASAVPLQEALVAGKRVNDAATSLRNLSSHARNTRDRLQGVIDTLDPPVLAVALAHAQAGEATRYEEQRRVLADWEARQSRVEAPDQHPPFRHDPVRGRDPAYALPFTIQVPDRYLRQQVTAVDNATHAYLSSCWRKNLPALGLGPVPPQVGQCQPMQARGRFGQWNFLRLVEHEVAARCSVNSEVLHGPLELATPPPPALLEQFEQKARADAVPQGPRLADALAEVERRRAEANELLARLEALFADIHAQLQQPRTERLAELVAPTPRETDGESTPAPPPGVEPEMQSIEDVCAQRQAEARARDAAVGGMNRSYIYYDESALRAMHLGVRPDFRSNTTDSCLQFDCPARIADDFGLDGCIAYQRHQLAPPEVTGLAVAWQLARDWRNEKLARVDRLLDPQGDSPLARYLDVLGTTACLAADVPPSLRDLKDLLGSALGTMFTEAGAPDPCSRYQSGPYSRALGR